MNKNIAFGIVAALIVIAIAFFAFHKPASAPTIPVQTATSTATAATTTATSTGSTAATSSSKTPSVSIGKPQPVRIATIDQSSLLAHTPRPTITGTANVSAVAIVIDNPQGVGIVGSSNVPVTNGHWSFTPPQPFTPGTYTVHLLGGDKQVDAKLVVTQ